MNDDPIAGRLRAMLRADVAAGALRPVRDYQRIFSGYDSLVLREYERFSYGSAAGSQAASPRPSTPLLDGPVATPGAGMAAMGPGPARATLDRLEAQGRERPDLVEQIARGGMATIHRARDPLLRREVAVKRLTADPRVRPDLVQRFLDEAQITAQLDHPGIVAVHRIALDGDGRPYFTMPLLRGRTLDRVFALARAQQEGWTLHRAVQVLQRVCDTLAYAHSKGVIHRDLKPDNVMVGSFGEVFVMDWGLAKVLRRAETADESDDARLSTDRSDALQQSGEAGALSLGIVIGTPHYMAPEQALARNDELDERADVYAVGALLYELLAGHPPYVPPGPKRSGIEILQDVVAGPPAPIDDRAPQSPEELRTLCARAMARDRADRPSSVRELGEALQRWLEGGRG